MRNTAWWVRRRRKPALKAISNLMVSDPALGTPDGDRLDVLATLVQAYEARHFPMDLPDAIEAIKFRMDQQGLAPKDLEPMIGRRRDALAAARAVFTGSEFVRSRQAPQRLIEGAQRRMPGLSGDFKYQAIGEAQHRFEFEMRQRGGNGIGVLQYQAFVCKQHVKRRRQLLGGAFIHRFQYPQGLRQHQPRDPSARDDEFVRRFGLPRVVPCKQADQNVGVNGPHGVAA